MCELDGDDLLRLARALTRSAVDAEFRRRLLTEPHAAVAEATGVELPPGFRIRFIEQPHDVDALIVLPREIEGSPADTSAGT